MGINDRFSNIKLRADNIVEIPEISAPSGNPVADKGWLYVKDDSGTSKLYFENSAGTVTDLIATTTTAWDDIADPDANSSISFSTYTQTFTSAGTAADMFTFEGTAAFGDVSIVKIEQKTGNPTDGTCLEVISADANVDALVVTANATSALVVGGDGNVAMANDLTVTGTATIGTAAITTFSATTLASSSGLITANDSLEIASGENLTMAEGSITITDSQDEAALTVTSSATTANSVEIVSGATTGAALKITADDLENGGALISLDSDNISTGRYYLKCYDGSANDLLIASNGITTITGANGTNVLNITAGHLNIDAGAILVDAVTDVASNITRNYNGAGTSPVLTVKDDHTSSTNYALQVTQDGTGGACMLVDPTGTTTNGIIFSVPASYTGQLIKVSDTLVGTNGEGIIDIHTTANMASGASLIRLDFDTGTLAGATNGFMLNIDDDSLVSATSYAVCINSNANEALYVQTGIAKFGEQITCDAGINCDGSLDVDFTTNAQFLTVDSTATDYAAGAGVVTIHGDHAGNTNDAALLRLVYQANGDAQDTYILCEDNSTGAAGNGDDMFKVASGGVVTAAGAINAGLGMSPGASAGTAQTTSSFHCARVEISNAAIKDLADTPVELVATPGAGKFLELESATLILDYSGGGLSEPSSPDDLVIQYGASGVDASGTIVSAGFMTAVADTVAHTKGVAIAGTALSNIVNDNLVLFNTGSDLTGAGSTSTLNVIIRYWIHDDTV